MKNPTMAIIALLFALPLFSFDNGGLVKKPMPVLPNKTLDGKTIDENYFKGHVTLVTFMYIGCPPCMTEISYLNKLRKEYAANSDFQILCVARQMRSQMEQFNTADTTTFYGKIRKALGTDSITYAIQPACPDGDSKMVTNGDHISMRSECSTIEDTYGISAYPMIFYVDRNGIIRDTHRGGPPTKNEEYFYSSLKNSIDTLLGEK